ncbi:MAG TPA: hypothetical protein DEA08_30545 [Planctomycetes bacterium]|nr:hypothetical protein [Planctomycetota bacterium]
MRAAQGSQEAFAERPRGCWLTRWASAAAIAARLRRGGGGAGEGSGAGVEGPGTGLPGTGLPGTGLPGTGPAALGGGIGTSTSVGAARACAVASCGSPSSCASSKLGPLLRA